MEQGNLNFVQMESSSHLSQSTVVTFSELAFKSLTATPMVSQVDRNSPSFRVRTCTRREQDILKMDIHTQGSNMEVKSQ